MSVTDFADLMTSDVTVESLSSRDEYLQPTYGTAVSFKARVSFKERWIRRSDGSTVHSRGEVWLLGTPDIDPEDRITLPGGDQPPILEVMRPSDEGGIHHTKVIFG